MDTPGGTQFQAVATYTCDSGFEVFGDKERTCQKTGQWSGVEPVCIITRELYYIDFFQLLSRLQLSTFTSLYTSVVSKWCLSLSAALAGMYI